MYSKHKIRDFELLGSDYETVYTGAEASCEGFYFKNYGITIVFDFEEEDSLVSWIDCDSDIGIFGIEEGMTFLRLIIFLGKLPFMKHGMKFQRILHIECTTK